MSMHLRGLPLAAALAAALSLTSAPALTQGQQGQQGQTREEPVPEPAAIAGKWDVNLDMAMGTTTVVFEFKQDGAKLTGTYAGRYGTFPLEGTVKGRALEFVVTTTIEGQASSLWFGGEVAEDGQTMKGPAELGGAGEAYWNAKRAK